MSRRCKAGQRARIIGEGANRGRIVVVVRHYYGEKVSGARWPDAFFPWVVTSLGSPLRRFSVDTGEERPSCMTIVCDDRDLEPLNDDDDGLDSSTEADKPVGKPVDKARKPEAACT